MVEEFDAKRFALWLRAAREHARLSTTRLAEMAHISKQYVSLLEKGDDHLLTNKPTQPSLDKVERLAVVLAVDIDDARELAGYPRRNGVNTKPQNVAEFIERLDQMGFDFYGFSAEDAETLTPDDLQDLMDQIETNIMVKVRRKKEPAG